MINSNPQKASWWKNRWLAIQLPHSITSLASPLEKPPAGLSSVQFLLQVCQSRVLVCCGQAASGGWIYHRIYHKYHHRAHRTTNQQSNHCLLKCPTIRFTQGQYLLYCYTVPNLCMLGGMYIRLIGLLDHNLVRCHHTNLVSLCRSVRQLSRRNVGDVKSFWEPNKLSMMF